MTVNKQLKKYVNLKIIGIGILLWLLLHIDIGQVVDILLNSHPVLVCVALVFMVLHSLVKFLRYQYILIQQGVRNPFWKTVRFSLSAAYLSFVTPGRIGEVSKAYFIHKDNGGLLNMLLAGSLVDRSFDVYTLLLAAMLGIVFMNPFGAKLVPIILVIVLVASAPLVFLIRIVRERLIDIIGWIERKSINSDTWSGHLHSFFAEIQSLLNWKILWGFAASFTAYALFFSACYLLSRSIDIPLSYFKVAVFTAYANILSFVPISFAGIGTREASLVYLFSIENLSREPALAFSTLLFSSTYLLFGLIGFLCLMTLKHSKKSLFDNA